MAQPLVSVVLPTHNRPVWLAEAITSVLEGKFQDFEVIVSNNGNPEDTRRLQAEIRDPRVRWLEQDSAAGPLENFLAGLAVARGTFVGTLHDDDRWSSDFLAVLVPPLQRNSETVLAFSDHYLVDEQGEVDSAATEVNTQHWGRADLRDGLHHPFFGLVARQSVAIGACVFRRDALPVQEIHPDVGPFDDVWISYLLARGGGAAFYTRKRLLYYRSHAAMDSATQKFAAHSAAIRFRRRMLEDSALRPYRRLIAERLARDHTLVGADLLRQGARRSARSHLGAAIRLDPTWKPLGGWIAAWIAPSKLLARL